MGLLWPGGTAPVRRKKKEPDPHWIAHAYQLGIRQGLDPEQFWRLTPYQTRLSMEGQQRRVATLAWLTAALTRQKKLPPLETFLGRSERKDPHELKTMLMGVRGKHG